MRGIVRRVSRGFAAVETESGGYVVLEVLGSPDPEVGDTVSGITRARGGQHVRNETQCRKLSVYVQALDGTRASAERLLQA